MSAEVAEFLGPPRSLPIINGGSATDVAWKWERQETGETHVWVRVALTAGVCLGQGVLLTLTAPLGPDSLLATSYGGRTPCGGGTDIAKNSQGLWDLLYSRNQWN